MPTPQPLAAPRPQGATTEQKLCTLLLDCGLGTQLHDRALYAASRTLWQEGYVRGRSKQERMADIIGHKLQLKGPGNEKSVVRAKIIAKADNDHFSLPEALDFMTWASRVNRPGVLKNTFSWSPVSTASSRRILAHLFELSFDMPRAEAMATTDRIRRRELDDIINMAKLTALLALETGSQYGAYRTWSMLSSMSFSARGALLAKAGAAGFKMKLVLIPLGAVGGVLGTASGLAAASSAVLTAYCGVMTGFSTACYAKVLWRDRFELQRPSLRDAAILGVIVTLNQRAHETIEDGDTVERLAIDNG